MEPARRARVPKQEEAWADAIQRARHLSRRDKAVWGLVEAPVGVGVKELDREPVRAKEEAADGSNINFNQNVQEVILCQDLIEQGPWGPVP
jgi:hypothetical protein